MENKDKLWKIRHTAEHVLMQAMRNLGYSFHMAMGPATDDGFYFDFELLEGTISESDFPKIEKEMQKIIDAKLPMSREVITEEKVRSLFTNNPYKQEWIDENVENGNELTIYWTGEPGTENSFVDLCAGPHTENTGDIVAFSLLSIAGAYWRGDEKNIMLTRIYGTAFQSQKELDQYHEKVELAKERDHRKIGKELDLFAFSELVGPGFVMYTPKGTVIRNELYGALLSASKKYGVQEVVIPHLAKRKLYETSGHAEKFEGELFNVVSHYDEEFVLKPVNCPHHTQIYASKPRSYRDLPLSYIESTQQHRDEKPGQIGGLTRTRSFTVDDGHTFCTVNQIKQEAFNICKIIEEFYTGLGLWGKHWVSLSIRDPQKPENYIGEVEDWDKAEKIIQEISDDLSLEGKVVEGEAAIYGPKIDYMFEDALGNERQLATVQIDFAMPRRFKLTYVDSDGQEKTPVMLHRAILGSYERFLAILIEHFGGAFPVWLQPIQVKILPISDEQSDYAYEVAHTLKQSLPNIRVEIDDSSETLQKKIRNAQGEKAPYMLILGKREVENNQISVRQRDGEQKNGQSIEEFIKHVSEVITSKSLEL